MILSDAALCLTCHTSIMTVDLPYVRIAAAARTLDGRAYSSVSQCCSLPRSVSRGPRTYMWAFIRVLSFLVVSMLRTFGRSQCGGDVDENAMLVVMAGVLVMRAKQ